MKKYQTRENPPRARASPKLVFQDAKAPSSLVPFHKGDICKELKGRFFHAEGSAAPCVAAITRFLKELGQRRGEVQCSVEKSGHLIWYLRHSMLSHPVNPS